MQLKTLSVALLLSLVSFNGLAIAETLAPGLRFVDDYTIVGQKNLLADYSPTNSDGTVNAVVEIPTGTLAKWEVSPSDGKLKVEVRNGQPRTIQYLGYPGNYGMIPRSVLAKEQGGDGDPLDVMILGPAVPRGSLVQIKLIGVLKLIDRGDTDDKLIAVMKDTPLYSVNSIEELDQKFPGVTTILQTWFTNYKGDAKVEVLGFQSQREAQQIFESAINAYTAQKQ